MLLTREKKQPVTIYRFFVVDADGEIVDGPFRQRQFAREWLKVNTPGDGYSVRRVKLVIYPS